MRAAWDHVPALSWSQAFLAVLGHSQSAKLSSVGQRKPRIQPLIVSILLFWKLIVLVTWFYSCSPATPASSWAKTGKDNSPQPSPSTGERSPSLCQLRARSNPSALWCLIQGVDFRSSWQQLLQNKKQILFCVQAQSEWERIYIYIYV